MKTIREYDLHVQIYISYIWINFLYFCCYVLQVREQSQVLIQKLMSCAHTPQVWYDHRLHWLHCDVMWFIRADPGFLFILFIYFYLLFLGVQQIMCVQAHHECKAWSPLRPGSRACLGALFLWDLSLNFKHSDTIWDKKP